MLLFYLNFCLPDKQQVLLHWILGQRNGFCCVAAPGASSLESSQIKEACTTCWSFQRPQNRGKKVYCLRWMAFSGHPIIYPMNYVWYKLWDWAIEDGEPEERRLSSCENISACSPQSCPSTVASSIHQTFEPIINNCSTTEGISFYISTGQLLKNVRFPKLPKQWHWVE